MLFLVWLVTGVGGAADQTLDCTALVGKAIPSAPMDDVVASTNSVNADCKDITPDRVVAVASVNPVIASTAGDGVVPAEGANKIVPAPAIDGVGSRPSRRSRRWHRSR